MYACIYKHYNIHFAEAMVGDCGALGTQSIHQKCLLRRNIY